MKRLLGTGTEEEPLMFIEDNDCHTYLIRASEYDRFHKWVEYMESDDGELPWEGHIYDSLGSHISQYRIIGEVRTK